MKKSGFIFLMAILFLGVQKSQAQIDLDHIDLRDLIGKVMYVEKAFRPNSP